MQDIQTPEVTETVDEGTHGHTPSGFGAMGHPVPWHRKSAALAAVRNMVPGITTDAATHLIDVVAQFIERDDPYAALANATGLDGAQITKDPSNPEPAPAMIALPVVLDVTGGYRLLAHLCTEPSS